MTEFATVAAFAVLGYVVGRAIIWARFRLRERREIRASLAAIDAMEAEAKRRDALFLKQLDEHRSGLKSQEKPS